jgi:uncharacterized OB-fold protein
MSSSNITSQDSVRARPAVPYLKIPENGEPYLVGSRCGGCGEIFLGERQVCARCYARNKMEPMRLSNHGRLYNYTVIYRSFPGVKVPFVAAVVDLDGGGTVKGTMIDVEPDPEKLSFNLPVDVVYRDAGQKDGNSVWCFFFTPAR